MHQFFVNSSLELKSKVSFDKEIQHQITKVLKLHTGEEILLSNTKVMAIGKMVIEKDSISTIIERVVDCPVLGLQVVCHADSLKRPNRFHPEGERSSRLVLPYTLL